MAYREQRFPNIDWYCDRCNAYLNSQRNFDDHHYIWKCTECGYKSSISRANITINSTPSKAINVIGKMLGALRSAVVYLSIAVLCNILILNTQLALPEWVLPTAFATYFVLIVLSMVFEYKIAKYGHQQKMAVFIFSSFFIYLLSDILRPIYEPFHMIKVLLLFAFSKTKWLFNLVETVSIGMIYVAILIAFIYTIIHMMI